jgi:pimeloyl-ACP methyl ester carboxylesterase
MRRRPALRPARAVAVVLAMVAVAAFALHPAVQATVKAVLVLDGALDGPLPRPWPPSVERGHEEMGDVAVDRYSPGADAPPILLVPGAAPAGRDDERVVAIATSLAEAGREVVVPELRLYQREVDVADVGRVVDVAAALCRGDRELVLFGFSYGGSLALVAAADERVAGCIGLVATFGAYADLVGVIQAAVTGISVVDGEVYPWEGADRSVVQTVVRDAAPLLVPEEQREPLLRALERRDPSGLPDAASLVYRIMNADDPEQVAALARRLPPPGDAIVETFSPVHLADEIEAEIVAVHALDDPAVPVAELVRLHGAFPDASVMTVRSFEHVDLDASGGLGPLVTDLVTAVTFMQAVLRAQEDWA